MVGNKGKKPARLIHDFILRHLNQVWTLMVGKVTYVDRATMRCKVQIKIKGSKDEQGVIINVPVVYPKGGNSIIMMPIKIGDVVLVGFTKYAIQQLIIDETVMIDEHYELQIQFSKHNAMILGGFVLDNDVGSTLFDTVDYEIPENEIVIVAQGSITLGKYLFLLDLGGDPPSLADGQIWRDGNTVKIRSQGVTQSI